MTFKPIKDALDTLNVYPDGWDQQPVKIEPNEPAPVEIQYERKWVALLTVPNQEEKATMHLTKISVMTPTVVYWPYMVTQAKVANTLRKQKPRPKSVFVGMVFASIAVGDIPGYRPFREFELTPGIRNYLRNGQGFPRYLSGTEMELVRESEARANAEHQPVKTCSFRCGDKVKLIDALMSTWPAGTIARLNRDGSYNVEIPGLFGRVTVMRLLANQVEAV